MRKEIKPISIGLDFDSTIAYNDYPFLGEAIPGAIETIKKLQSAGHTLILITMRENHLLDQAVEFLLGHGIEMKYKNCNPEFETGSRKIYCQCFIDDHNLGIKLIHDTEIHQKPFVDWKETEKLLEEKGYL